MQSKSIVNLIYSLSSAFIWSIAVSQGYLIFVPPRPSTEAQGEFGVLILIFFGVLVTLIFIFGYILSRLSPKVAFLTFLINLVVGIVIVLVPWILKSSQ